MSQGAREFLALLNMTMSAAAEDYKEKLRGDKGDRGEKGERGDKGAPGKDGYTPRKGVDYFDGVDGAPGRDGKDGRDGLTPDIPQDLILRSVRMVFDAERASLQGPEGKAGPAGIPGMRMRGEWKFGERYSVGDLVALGGDIWYKDNDELGKPGKGTAWKLFLRSQAGRLSGYGVVQQRPGGIGESITGGVPNSILWLNSVGALAQMTMTATRIPFADASAALTDSANLVYSEASGPRLTVGSGSGGSSGLIIGHHPTSGYAAIWGSSATPSTGNYVFATSHDGADVYLRSQGAGSTISLYSDTALKVVLTATAGQGPSITMGTATTDVGTRLTQTWNAAGVAFTGIKFTITDTASAAGSLAMQVLGGVAGATVLGQINKSGYAYYPLLSVDTGLELYNTAANATSRTTSGRIIYIGPGTTAAVSLAATYGIGWSSNTIGGGDAASSIDSGIVRNAAGVVEVNNGSAGTFRDLKLRSLLPVVGTITADTPAVSSTATWNAAGTTFTHIKHVITDTASAAGSLAMQILGGVAGATTLFSVDKNGAGTFAQGLTIGAGYIATIQYIYNVPANTSIRLNQANGIITLASGAAESGFDRLQFGGTSSSFPALKRSSATLQVRLADDSAYAAFTALSHNIGADEAAASSVTKKAKAVTGIADAVATTVFTVTVPNAAHSASIRVRLTGSAGAGGAVGANEATQDAEYQISVTRTAGVNAVATIGALYGQAASATVAGGNNIAVTATLGAITGAVGASNTFTIQVTITRAAGAATNHTCMAFAELLNANATGVTIA